MKLSRISTLLIVVVFIAGLSGPPLAGSTARIQPALAQIASLHPTQTIHIIVQKTAKNSGVEQQVAALGGQVTKDLGFINAFAADVKGEAALELARNDSVRWVSLDAPITSSDATRVSVSWATAVGSVISNQYTNPGSMVDSAGLGPDGAYGYAAGNSKGTFGGFNVEAVPGNTITKVEAVIYAYVNDSYSKDFRIKLYENGQALSGVSVKTSIFSNNIGVKNAGLVYVDITAAEKNGWQWAEFYNNLELYIEQAGFSADNTLFYDAVGLRITSAPGVDSSLDSLPPVVTADSTVDTSQLVNVYPQVIGATQLWNSTNKLQGKQIGVAVVDSGILKTNDLDGRVKVNINFNPAFHNGIDRYGHGTFVAGIIAGNGNMSHGQYIGVAPKATLLNVRVSNDQGMMNESDVINALQWVYANKDKYKISIINLSLNSSVAQSYNTSPMDAAVEILWFNGIVVVVSGGNNGSGTIFPPANDPFVITVGATDDRGTASIADDTVATFSAFGKTESGFAKPDLVAPGRLIIGLLPENKGLEMAKVHPKNQVDATYFKMSGTSVSAPMVSGAVAILLQNEPNLNPDQVKYRLMATANKNWPAYNPTTGGAGYLDIYAAVSSKVTNSANQGIVPSQMLATGSNAIDFASVGWNSVGWNSVGWNSVGWNSVGWNSVGWNSVGWNSVGWNSDDWSQ